MFKVDLKDKEFKKINTRLQAFFTFYIDGASFISEEDEDWSYFMIYSGKVLQAYATVYH
jgi:hypothetical protein